MKQIILMLTTVLFFSQCGDYKKLALGRDERVVTFCSEAVWPEVEDTLRSAVQHTVRTPQEEKIFFLDKVMPGDFEGYQHNKNLVLMAALDQDDASTEFVKKFISAEALELIRSDREYFFPIRDHLARRQLFLVIAAPTKEKLTAFLEGNGDRLYMALSKAFIDRQMEQLYHKAEEKELSKELMEKYGFTFRLPNDYQIVMEDKQRNILQIGRTNPYRWITVYWRDEGFQSVLNKEWAWTTRSWMARQIMDDTYIEKRYLTTRTMYWDDLFVNNLRGLWAHEEKAMGGPFSVFYFYDGVSDRIYFIDLSLWAPGEYKNVYLRQMELIVSSFESRSRHDIEGANKKEGK